MEVSFQGSVGHKRGRECFPDRRSGIFTGDPCDLHSGGPGPLTSTLWGHGRGDTAEVAVLPSELTPSPSHSLGSGAHPKRWVLLAPDHSTLLQPATQVQGVVSGETSGKVPRACRAAPPFSRKRKEGPRIWGQSLHPHPPWPEASVHPVTWPLGDGPALGWSRSPRTPPSQGGHLSSVLQGPISSGPPSQAQCGGLCSPPSPGPCSGPLSSGWCCKPFPAPGSRLP